MKHIADVYGRALFPSRYAGPRGDKAQGQLAELTADGLDLAIASGLYRLVNAVEGLLGGLRPRPRSRPSPVTAKPAPSPVGCG